MAARWSCEMFPDKSEVPAVSNPFEYAQAYGCDYFLAKTIEVIITLSDEDKFTLARIIKSVIDSIYCNSEAKKQNDRLNELAKTILKMTHYGSSVTNTGSGNIDQSTNSTTNNFYSSSEKSESGKLSE